MTKEEGQEKILRKNRRHKDRTRVGLSFRRKSFYEKWEEIVSKLVPLNPDFYLYQKLDKILTYLVL